MTIEQKAFANALLAWLNSQEVSPRDAIVAMVVTAATAVGSIPRSLEALADGISLVQRLVLISAVQAYEQEQGGPKQ